MLYFVVLPAWKHMAKVFSLGAQDSEESNKKVCSGPAPKAKVLSLVLGCKGQDLKVRVIQNASLFRYVGNRMVVWVEETERWFAGKAYSVGPWSGVEMVGELVME